MTGSDSLRSAAAYLRVSSEAQSGDDRFGLQVQAGLVTAYAARHGFQIAQTYSDVISGTRHRREQLDALLDAAPRYEAVIISSVDRLGRRNRVVYTVLDELLETGLQVHSTDMGPIDPDDESSMLSFGVRSLFAEQDHRSIVKKLTRARLAKVTGNPLTGRPGEPVHALNGYGWRNGVRDEVEVAWLTHIYTRLQHVGGQALATELEALGVRTRAGGPWRSYVLTDLVRNPMYKGEYHYGRGRRGRGEVKAVCQVPALISVELWESTNRRLTERNAKSGVRAQASQPARSAIYLLAGHLRCGECGRVMAGATLRGRSYGYYICKGTSPTRHRNIHPCTQGRHYRPELIHDLVRVSLEALGTDDAALLSMTRVPERAAPNHAPALVELAKREDRLEAAYMAGAYTPEEYAERRGDLKRQGASILNAPAPAAAPPVDLPALRARVAQALALPLPQLAALLGLTVRVSLDGGVAIELDPPVV